MKTKHKVIICAGIPRTGTTALQQHVFPNANGISYIGKPHDNTYSDFDYSGYRSLIDSLDTSVELDYYTIRILSNSLCQGLSGNYGFGNIASSLELFQGLLNKCIQIQGAVPLYSDESLIESAIGRSARLPSLTKEQLPNYKVPDYTFNIPIEMLSKNELNPYLRVCVTLRNPEKFLKASYAKCIEWAKFFNYKPFSYESYITAQIRIWKVKPEASRIFLASHKKMKKYVESLFSDVVVSHYEDLIVAPNVLDTLFGQRGDWDEVSMKSLPRENSSFSEESLRQFILSAPGIPTGIEFDEYTETFPAVLAKYDLLDYLKSQRLAGF